LAGTDEFERHGGRTFTRLRPTRSYTTLRDVTAASRSAEVAAHAFEAGIRAILADAPPNMGPSVLVAWVDPPVDPTEIEIRVPLRNVGSGLALVQGPSLKLTAEGISWRSRAATTAVPAGEVAWLVFAGSGSTVAQLDRDLHENIRQFTVVARCTDMNGNQPIRTRATVAYLPPLVPTPDEGRRGSAGEWRWLGEWRFEAVELFEGESQQPFATLGRSVTVALGQVTERDEALPMTPKGGSRPPA